MVVAANLVDPSSLPVSWKNIGGLDNIITEMKVPNLSHFLLFNPLYTSNPNISSTNVLRYYIYPKILIFKIF